MKASQAIRRTLPYAHLLGGLGARAKGAKGAGAEDVTDLDEPEKEDEDDEETLGDGEEEREGKRARKRTRKSAVDDDDTLGPDDAEDEDDDEDEDEEPAGRRAREAAEEDDGDESAKAARAARRRERARCRAIFRCEAAGVRPDLAAHLAFETGMSSADAIVLLKSAAAGGAVQGFAHGRLGERMAQQGIPNVGPGGGGPMTLAQQIVSANNKRLGLK